LRERLHWQWRRHTFFNVEHMFEHPAQPSSIVLETANLHPGSVRKEDNDVPDCEISHHESEARGETTLPSNIEGDNVDHKQDDLHLGPACHDATLWRTRAPQETTQSCADTVIACIPLPKPHNPAGAIAPPLLKCEKSTINTILKYDHVPAQALPHPKAGADQNAPHPKASEDHNVP